MSAVRKIHHSDLEYRPDIDGLRAIAVLAVVIFHMAPSLLPGGFIGVDVFFVLSGYLISLIIFKKCANQTFTVKDFYIRRTKRIFPTLIVALLGTWIMGYCFLLKDEFRNLGKHMYSGAFFFSNITLWKEAGYFDVASEMKPLLHLWSLSIEEQFYIFWPLLAALSIRKKWNVTGIILGIVLVSLGLNLYLINNHFTSTFFLLHTRAWELLAGAYLAALEFKKTDKVSVPYMHASSVTGILLILIPCFVFSGADLFPGWRAIFPVVGTFLLVKSGPSAWVNKHILSLKPMIWVGLISYPLYLWHWPLLSYARILDGGEAALSLRILLVLLAFVLAWMTYKFIEQPIRFGIPKAKEGRYALVIVGVLFAFGILGLMTKNQKSWKILSGNEQEELFKVPSFTSGNCPYKVPENAYCNQSGDNPNVAIIGDSFSLAMYPGLRDYYRNQGKNVIHFGRGSCPPLLGVSVRTKGESEICSAIINQAFDNILTLASVKDVVLIGRWSAYLDPKEVTDFSSKYETDRKKVLENGLLETIKALIAAGKSITFVHAVPDLGFDPKSCLKLRKFQLREHNSACSVSQTTIETQQEVYRGVLAKVLVSVPQVKTFDPLPFLCQNGECRGKMNGVLLYRDKTHLSIAGSIEMARQFAF